MQQQQQNTIQKDGFDNIAFEFNTQTDPSELQDQQANENKQTTEEDKSNSQQNEQENENKQTTEIDEPNNQQNKRYQVTQQPTSSHNLDSYNRTSSIYKSIGKKKKRRRRRCCRKSKQSDKEWCDDCGVWLCCDNYDCGGCSSCGSCGSCSCSSFGD